MVNDILRNYAYTWIYNARMSDEYLIDSPSLLTNDEDACKIFADNGWFVFFEDDEEKLELLLSFTWDDVIVR